MFGIVCIREQLKSIRSQTYETEEVLTLRYHIQFFLVNVVT